MVYSDLCAEPARVFLRSPFRKEYTVIGRPVVPCHALRILLLIGVLSPVPPEAIAQAGAPHSVTGVVKDPAGAAAA